MPATARTTSSPAHLLQRITQLCAVMMLVGLSALCGQTSAHAAGFNCKDVPAPQSPNSAAPAFFDSGSVDRPAESQLSGTGYGGHGWAGLTWHIYDLGCGEDITGVSLVRNKTDVGNTFLTIGQSFAAAAFWLDEQANIPAEGRETGREGAIARFDEIVLAVSDSLRPTVYGPWLGLGVAAAGLIILYRGLRSDAPAVFRQLAIGAGALAIGGLMVGAPAKAIQISDDTFSALITKTQREIFNSAGMTDDPRLVITDRIIIPDVQRGYFGSNASEQTLDDLWPKLRESIAYTYDEQARIQADNSAQKAIDEAKAEKFRREVVEPLESKGLSFYTFQGKDSSRVTTGFLSMVKTSMPSILWIGSSVLKLSALLAIRLAIITAPVWVPLAIVSGSILLSVGRILGGIYLWAVGAAVLMSVYLLILIKLYRNVAVDGTWRLWFLVILTIVFWMLLRPFKRLSQTITQSHRGMIGGAMDRHKHGSWKQKLLTASSMVTNPAMGLAEKSLELARGGINRSADGAGRQWSDMIGGNKPPIIRQEGRALSAARIDDYRGRAHQAQLAALRGGAGGALADLRKASPEGPESGTRLPGVNLTAGPADGTGDTGLADLRKHTPATGFTDGFESLDTGDSEVFVPHQDANRWDGGPGAVIAPTTIYRPSEEPDASGKPQRPWVSITRPAPASSARPVSSDLPRAGLSEDTASAQSTGVLDRPNRDLGVNW
ncbi:hypothetical protein O4328_20910 [Rhodococcus opacus]|uniref:Integral membrane protein n=1 Tax=Rhodococcus opacus TaxID=37919 RepID=A0AAX3YU69_RHOOP|nr:hypothetical protein [Rhodococcus opacus]MCZ4586117.1 hypothetical protein [Rhodococcus opacus]WLF51946.1 hypothetical protein Q5707_41510 [Rhodococcus opacus]